MRQASEKRRKRCSAGLCLALALLLSAAGCGGGGDDTVVVPLAVTLAPTAVSVLVSSFVQFAVAVNASVDSLKFFVNDVEGGNGAVGTITEDGLYQAPAVVPANATITVKVTAADSTAGTSAEATATVTLDSGVRLSIAPSTYTIGTAEQFLFATKVRVIGVPPNASISGVCDTDPLTALPLCTAVTWSVSASGGTIDAATGNYTAPAAAATAIITATSIYDTGRSASATASVVTATDPTVTAISNTVGAVGAVQQDVYLTGTDFLSTTQVRANGNLLSETDLVSATVLRVRLADSDLTSPGTLTFTVARPGETEQTCATAASCELTLLAQRPAVLGTTPDSIPSSSTAPITVTGGYYGTPTNPTVTADFEGQSGSIDSANQLSISLPGVSTPGLAPVTVTSNVAALPSAIANVAIQPGYSGSLVPSASLIVGTQPSSVAINTATGIAVVANQGSHSVALIDLAGPTVRGFICTGTPGATLSVAEPSCPASAPTSVAVDNLRNLALVTNSNSALKNVAVIDLATESVREIIPSGVTSIADVPWGVGINPVSGRAVVAYQTAGFASIINLNQVPVAVTGLVAASTGATPRVAVSPKVNWALVTPGGAGSLAIVDLSRQDTNPISSAVRSGNVVTITTGTVHTLRVGDPVLITGVTDPTFNGVFNVTGVSGNTFTYSQSGSNVNSGSGTASYSLPIATVATSLSVTGVGINDETQKAILTDETGPQLRVFGMLDQTSAAVPGVTTLFGPIAAAFNPLTNVAVAVNFRNSNGSVIDPVTPVLLGSDGIITGLNQPVDVAIDPATNAAVIANSGACAPPAANGCVSIVSLGALRAPQILNVSRQDNGVGGPLPPEVTVNSTLTTAATANPQTLTVIGSGFTGASVVRLDGTNLATTFVNSRSLTAAVSAAMLTAGPRLYALDVANGGAVSNAATFTVVQAVDVSSSGCAAPTSAPQGVAIDHSSRNLAVVTNPGCNNVAIIQLGGANVGTGATVAVGTNPEGVAVYTQSALAVIANSGSRNASIVDLNANTVVATVTTEINPTGVAIDQGLGLAVVTHGIANVISTFAVSATPGGPTVLPVQLRPIAVAIDPVGHFAAVANTTSNTVSLVDLKQTTFTEHVSAPGFPAGIAFDPVSSSFLTVQSLANSLLVLDPVSRSTIGLRIGINPTSIAYNYNSGTVVTTNSASQTMTVLDFISGRVRAVLSFKPSGRFAVDIHPFTNLAVIADSAGNRVILRPLPR